MMNSIIQEYSNQNPISTPSEPYTDQDHIDNDYYFRWFKLSKDFFSDGVVKIMESADPALITTYLRMLLSCMSYVTVDGNKYPSYVFRVTPVTGNIYVDTGIHFGLSDSYTNSMQYYMETFVKYGLMVIDGNTVTLIPRASMGSVGVETKAAARMRKHRAKMSADSPGDSSPRLSYEEFKAQNALKQKSLDLSSDNDEDLPF